MKKQWLVILMGTLFVSFFATNNALAQDEGTSLDSLNKKYLNWYNSDPEITKVQGVAVESAYIQILNGMTAKKKIVVAVIDGGVDIYHEDLKGKIWQNKKEIADNAIDDDGNGYIDDMHGWNFIGNSKGENIKYENFEYVRMIREMEPRYRDVASIDQVADSLKDEYNTYLACKHDFKKQYDISMKRYRKADIDFHLNIYFQPRKIISDDLTDISDAYYGNNDVKSMRSDHGTFVAGIIAANRQNQIGIDGIASSVEIMVLRTVPSGDERDKDVALSIRYAVENGANIINMSFCKNFSPHKSLVDEAIKYASDHNVLMIHASGNEALNLDEKDVFPLKKMENGVCVDNWINVGATSMKSNKIFCARFSNYGQKSVDIFAPGVNILSLYPENKYNIAGGTSFACPVVSGVAALVWSYYPDLSASELKNILLESSYKYPKLKVLTPNIRSKKKRKVKFGTLSESGGIVNALEALKRAQIFTEKDQLSAK